MANLSFLLDPSYLHIGFTDFSTACTCLLDQFRGGTHTAHFMGHRMTELIPIRPLEFHKFLMCILCANEGQIFVLVVVRREGNYFWQECWIFVS